MYGLGEFMLYMKEYIRYSLLAAELTAGLAAKCNECAVLAMADDGVMAKARKEFALRISRSHFFWEYLTKVLDESLFDSVNLYLEQNPDDDSQLLRLEYRIRCGKVKSALSMPHSIESRYRIMAHIKENDTLKAFLIKDRISDEVYGEIVKAGDVLPPWIIDLLEK